MLCSVLSEKFQTVGHVAYLVIYVKIVLAGALVSETPVFFVYLSQYMATCVTNLWGHKAHG